jgi:hypothetical protein
VIDQTREVAASVATSEQIGAALQWTEVCRVVPCDGKNPGALIGKGWQCQATRDASVVREWWQRWPAANIGIVAGRDVLQVVDRPAEWQRFQRDLGAAPPTPVYVTGGEPGRVRADPRAPRLRPARPPLPRRAVARR